MFRRIQQCGSRILLADRSDKNVDAVDIITTIKLKWNMYSDDELQKWARNIFGRHYDKWFTPQFIRCKYDENQHQSFLGERRFEAGFVDVNYKYSKALSFRC